MTANETNARMILIDCERAMAIPLTGKHGRGREAIVDVPVWHQIERDFGAEWRGITDGKGHFYVASGRREASRHSRQRCDAQLAYLARLITGAHGGQIVRFKNRDPFDLRLSNLMLEDRRTKNRRSVPEARLPDVRMPLEEEQREFS